MTPDQLAQLAAEVRDDPQGIGYAQHLPASPGVVVGLLTAPTQTALGVIHSSTAQAWAATGPMSAIVDTASDRASLCRASCLLVQTTLASGSDIHMERPDVQQMFKAWLDEGVITDAWHADLIARATQPASRVQVLGLPNPDVYDLINAGVV